MTTVSAMRRGRGVVLLSALVIAASSAGLVLPLASPAVAADIAAVDCSAPTVSTGRSAPDPSSSFEPQAPERVVDTRKGTGGVDGALDAGCTLRIDTATLLPADAAAIALSLTVISPEVGFFTAFPCSAGLPETSNVNARSSVATANLVIVEPDDDSMVCVYSSGGGHVIADVSGWFGPGPNRFASIDPVRAVDTRSTGSKLPANAIREIEIAGSFVPADAVAVAINVAAVRADEKGFVVAYPCGGEVPLASNLNFVAGENRAASAIVEVGTGGRVCISSNVTTHLIADLTGYYAPTEPLLSFAAVGPTLGLSTVIDTRVADTRTTSLPGDRFDAGSTQRFALRTLLDSPDDTVAVALNVVATRASSPGFVTVYPCTERRPTTSSLNYDGGQTANLVLTKVSAAAEVCVYTSTSVDMAVDLFGAFAEIAEISDVPVNAIEFRRRGQASALVPDQVFDAGFDYTLRCGTVDENLTIDLDLDARVSALVDGRPFTGTALDVSLPNDGLVTVTLVHDARRQDYAFRCLPARFPTFDVTISGPLTKGWYLTTLGFMEPTFDRYVVILDERAVPVWFKRTDDVTLDFKRLSDGTLITAPLSAPGFGVGADAGYLAFGLDGVVDGVRRTDDPARFPTDFHDYLEIVQADGRSGRAHLSYPLLFDQDLRLFNDALPNEEIPFTEDDTIVDGVIRELDADGRPVWTWRASDHFGYDEVGFPGRSNLTPENEADPFHLNSIDRVDDGSGDYVVSARGLDAVFEIDRTSGDVDWILSSLPTTTPTKSGATRLRIVGDPLGGPLRQHDARVVGDRVTMYDNRTANGNGEAARFVEYEIDEAAGTATLVRQIDQPEGLQSLALGSARARPDGSVTVGWSQTQPMFGEYDANDDEVLRVTMDPTDWSYRILKETPDAFDVDDLRANAGGSLPDPTT